MSRLRILAVLSLLVSGCVSVDYVGKTYAPTTNVELFMSADDVERPYEVMGEVRAQVDTIPFSNPGQQLQQKLITEARAKGADAIILGQLSDRQVGSTSNTTGQAKSKWHKGKKKTDYVETTTSSTDDVTELRGTLIRYRAQ